MPDCSPVLVVEDLDPVGGEAQRALADLTLPLKTAVPAAWSRSSRSEVISTGWLASWLSPNDTCCAAAAAASAATITAASPTAAHRLPHPGSGGSYSSLTPSPKEKRRASPSPPPARPAGCLELMRPSGPVVSTASPAIIEPARRSSVTFGADPVAVRGLDVDVAGQVEPLGRDVEVAGRGADRYRRPVVQIEVAGEAR